MYVTFTKEVELFEGWLPDYVIEALAVFVKHEGRATAAEWLRNWVEAQAAGRPAFEQAAEIVQTLSETRAWGEYYEGHDEFNVRDESWRNEARSGKLIAAIKAYRTLYGTSLKQAKDQVEGYLDHNGYSRI